MSMIFNRTKVLRNLIGAVAAVLIGSTVLGAAVGPAFVTPSASQNVNSAANSDIVGAA